MPMDIAASQPAVYLEDPWVSSFVGLSPMYHIVGHRAIETTAAAKRHVATAFRTGQLLCGPGIIHWGCRFDRPVRSLLGL
jgi:hypothetical protein